MAQSVFDDRASQPTRTDLEEALGASTEYLTSLEQQLGSRFGPISHEWKFYGRQSGWTLALKHENRRILHLIPRPGHFTVAFVLGKRAVEFAREHTLPESIMASIESAPEYVEGRGVRFEVTSPDDVAIAVHLAEIKMSH